jgi:type I restriction enzyme M protein
MSRETLNTQFWKAAKILRQDDNTNSLLDYVEQISWLLFLKCFEELEKKRRDEAEFEGKPYRQIIANKFQWSSWTNPDPSTKLTGQALLVFLHTELFPHLRNLKGANGSSVIRALFEEAPSKMLKDGNILRDAIDAIQEIQFEGTDDIHTLSHLYESLLAKLGREGGFGGEFYTPRPIIEFVVNMVDPKLEDTVYDPAMGSAGFLVEAYKHMRAELGIRIQPDDERKLQRDTFFGQEKKPLPYLLGCMNMILHGVLTPSLNRRNTLADDVRKFTEKDRFDIILTNPPFGGTEHESVTANFRYPSKATSITFLQHIMAKVKRGGRVGMVIDEGVLERTIDKAYVDTKKELLEQFNLHTVVSLPAGVFANAVASGTGPKTSLLFFERKLDEAGRPISTKEIWYYAVEDVGFSLTKAQTPLADNDLPECLELARTYALSPCSWIVSVEEVAERNFDLSAVNPNRKTDYAHRAPAKIVTDLLTQAQKATDSLEELHELLQQIRTDETDQFTLTPLSDLLIEVSRPERVEKGITYHLLGMRWYAKGLFIKDTKPGDLIKAKYVYLVKKGDLIYNRLFAWKGSFGIAGANAEGAYVSNEFPCFTINKDKVLPSYLLFFMSQQAFWDEVSSKSRGSSRQSRLRLKQEHFLSLSVPLPKKIEHQQAIIDKVQRVVVLGRIHEGIAEETKALLPAILDRAFKGKL